MAEVPYASQRGRGSGQCAAGRVGGRRAARALAGNIADEPQDLVRNAADYRNCELFFAGGNRHLACFFSVLLVEKAS